MTLETDELERLLLFIIENSGVLVGVAANGNFCCQRCGQQALFASAIKHGTGCLLGRLIKAEAL